MKSFLLALVIAPLLLAQDGSFPLESVNLDGSTANRNAVLAIAELQIGKPIDKAGIEAACTRLQAAGLFDSISYKYAPAKKGGIALTLSLSDQRGLTDASIDVPGLDETETWEWLKTQFPNFDHKVPGADAAEQYLAKSLEQHLGDKLKGQHLVPRMESDLKAGHLLISFQPEILPKVAAINFTGQQEIPADKLRSIIANYAQSQGYTARLFRQIVELNLRPAYEDHGMYRVKFPTITMQFVDGGGVALTTAIEEGPKYKLGNVAIVGEGVPADDLLKIAQFKPGDVANWSEIQKSLNATQTPMRRQGYLNVDARSERLFDDQQHVLNLKVNMVRGPQFHFGSVRFQGLTPDQEAQARKVWTLNAGQPLDPVYPNEFLAAFAKKADLRQFKKRTVKMQPGTGEHVVDLTMNFD